MNVVNEMKRSNKRCRFEEENPEMRNYSRYEYNQDKNFINEEDHQNYIHSNYHDFYDGTYTRENHPANLIESLIQIALEES